MEISSGDSTPTEEAAAGGGALSDAAAPRLGSLTAVSLSAALPRLLESAAPGGETPPAEDRGPPTPTLSEPVDTPDRRADRECAATARHRVGGQGGIGEDWRKRGRGREGMVGAGRQRDG